MFTADTRSRLLASLVERARSDGRISAAALVGSLAGGTADAFSDIDLSFGLVADARLEEVVEDWTRHMVEHEGAVVLFDLEARGTQYRVFLRDDCLQIDLSFTPGGEVRKASPRFVQLFGRFHEAAVATPEYAQMCGWAVHLAHAARVRIERGRVQQAHWCVSELHEQLVSVYCAARDLAWAYGRGADELPEQLRANLDRGIAAATDPSELDRALGACIDLLVAYDGPGREVIVAVRPQFEQFRHRLAPPDECGPPLGQSK